VTSHNGASALATSRLRMLDLLRRHIHDQRVIDAMAQIPRERFTLEHMRARAYDDQALPISEGQTISQPLIVAMMVEALQLQSNDRVLEVGAGSGYAAAVISRIAADVIAVERIPQLCQRAQETIAALNLQNVRIELARDELGRKEGAPYDAILVSAGAPHIPRTLLDQLGHGGRLVVPIGSRRHQELVRATNTSHGVELVRLGPCAFVPLIGEEGWDGTDNDVSRRSKLR
jgi:protein-L-isoaspartate(D-aspartate) O-methyltransferase